MSGRGLGKMEPRKRDSARLKSAPCTGYHLQLGPPPSRLPPTGTKIQGLTAGLQKPAEETILGRMQQVTLLPDWPDDDEDTCHLEASPPQEAHFAPAPKITEQVRRHSGPLSGPPPVKHGFGKANRSMPLTTVMEDGTIHGSVGLNQPVTNNGVHTQVGWGADVDDRDVSSTVGSILAADFGSMRPMASGNSPTSTLEEPWSHDMSRWDGGKSRSWKDRLTTAATKIKDISTKAPSTILRRMNHNGAQPSSNPSTPDSLTSPSPTFRTLWDQDLRASEGWPVVANYSGGSESVNKRFLFGTSRPLILEQWEDQLFGARLNGSGAFPELEADGFQTNTQTDSSELRKLTASTRASAPAPTPSPSPLHLNATNCCETEVRERRHPPSPELGVTDDGNANDTSNDDKYNNKPLPIPPLLQWSSRKSSTSTHEGIPHSGVLSGKIDAQRDSNGPVASGELAVENAFERLQNGVSMEQEELKKGLILVLERERGGSEGSQSTGTESSYGLGVGEIDTESVGSREGREERELNLPKFSRLIEKKGVDEEAYAVGDHRTNRRVAVPRFQWEIEKQGGGTRGSGDVTEVALPDDGGRKKSHSWSGEEKSETKTQHVRKRSFPLDSSSRLAPPSSLAEKKGAEVDHHVISSEAKKATCGSNPEQEYLQSSGDDCEVLREVVERVVREMHEKGLTSKNYMRRLESKRAIVREEAAKQHLEETAVIEEREKRRNTLEASTAKASNSMIVASNLAEDVKAIMLAAKDEGRLIAKSDQEARTVIEGGKENGRRDRAAETVKEGKRERAQNVALSADVKGVSCEEAQVASAVVGDRRTSSAMLRRREAAAEFWGVRPGNLAPGVSEDWQTLLDLLPDEGMGLDEDGSASSSDGDLNEGCDLQAPSDAESMLVNPGSPRRMPLSSTLQKIQEVPVIAKIRPQTHRLSDIRVQNRHHLHTWGPSTATSSRSSTRRPSPAPVRTSSATFLHNGVPLKSCLREGDRREQNNVVAVRRRFPSPQATWQVPDRPPVRPPSPSIVRTGIWRDGRWHDVVDANLIRRKGRESEEDPGKSFKEELSQKLQAAAAAQKVRRAERLRVSFESPVVQSSWSATDRRLSVWSDPGPEGAVAMYDMDDVAMDPARPTHGDCRPFAGGGLEALRLAIKGEDSEEFLRKSYPG